MEIIHTELFFLVLVIGIYVSSLYVYNKTKLVFLHPILPSVAIVIIFLKTSGISYSEFKQGARFIDFLLGPSVVAIGYLLYEQYEHIKENILSIMTSIITGSFVGIISVIIIARLMGASQTIIATLQPKSVTTPIAIEITKNSGGIPALTAVIVISVGILGAITSTFILDKLRIKSKVARGLAIGASSHGIGTTRAIELGALEGAISGLAIGLMGVATAVWIPVIEFVLSFLHL